MLKCHRVLSTVYRRHLSTVVLPTVDPFEVKNEPVLQYSEGSKERDELKKELDRLSNTVTEVGTVIGGQRLTSGQSKTRTAPFDHSKTLCKYVWADGDAISSAITASQKVRPEWERVPIQEKIKIFLKAGDLVAGKYRHRLNAATMLGQGKTVVQAEIDAACELADFFRFNAWFAMKLHEYQPLSPQPDVSKNFFRFRGLEGFLTAVTPFNFTAIGGNLPSAPTLMGNVVLWKPSEASILSNWFTFELLKEAGIPDGVINFLPSRGSVFGDVTTRSSQFAGVNFTGSVPTFRRIWQQVANNLDVYMGFPRLIGECGGKNYHFIHPSADLESAVPATIRSAFEYSGQKCSACSRLYVAESIWPKFKDQLLSIRSQLKCSTPLEFDTFLSAVIDQPAFVSISEYILYCQLDPGLTILGGGKFDGKIGNFIEPTIIESKNPKSKLMREEIFGPVLTVYVYKDKDLDQALKLADETSGFALTGSVFAQDKDFLKKAAETLKNSAGNFYINDKSTGSVVNNQPFGGGRLSGTNDKAGGPHYLIRWTSPQNVKETYVKQDQWAYPSMKAK